ncbi:hypothetical protein AAFC00_004920 [Neodothiora populina]
MTEPYQTGIWLESQISGNAPFSPELDAGLPTSEASFDFLRSATSQDMPVADAYASAGWPAELPGRSYIDESTFMEQGSFFPMPESIQPEIPHTGYQSWYTPSEVNFEQYFQMEPAQGQMPEISTVGPQIAGFVGSAPLVPSTQGSSYYRTAGLPSHNVEQLSSAQMQGPQYQGQSGAFPQQVQAQEIQESRPRRLSVAVNPSGAWSAEESDRAANAYAVASGPVSVHGPHRSSMVSNAGTVSSMLSSSTNGVPVKLEGPFVPSSPVSSRARSEDSEGKPRSHKYYTTAKPLADGHYHCPYATKEKCSHKPTKLKCNYDKYIDSHLKPFVCKQPGCKGADNENRFSSTACLLRHEREAHGLHGHGQKPYLCKYDKCERSIPGNGFPRNYNLMDHMKRVHRHPAEETRPGTPGSSSSKRSTKADNNSKVRKRKSDSSNGHKRSISNRRQAAVASPTSTLASQEWADLSACKDKYQQQLRRMEEREHSSQVVHHFGQEVSHGFH